MDTQTEVMRQTVRRIGGHRHRTAHRRPIETRTPPPPATAGSGGDRTPTASPCAPEVRYESPLPHAGWIIGVVLLALVAGVMLGLGVANHWR